MPVQSLRRPVSARTAPLPIFLRVHRLASVAGLAVLVALACHGDATGPGSADYVINVEGGQYQFGTPGDLLAEPLRVAVIDTRGSRLAPDVTVHWRILSGPGGAALTADSTRTDSLGIASVRLRLGSTPGEYEIEASVRASTHPPAVFKAWGVHRPELHAITPNPARAGDTISIVGANFSPHAPDNEVLVGGLRAEVVSATETGLLVIVPPCTPERALEVRVRLGAVASAGALPLEVRGGTSAPVALERGESVRGEGALCVSLPGGGTLTEYLAVVQNASEFERRPMPFRLAGLAGGGLAAALAGGPLAAFAGVESGFASGWESELREREAALLAAARHRPAPYAPAVAAAEVPSPGDRRTFKVLDAGGDFTEVTAEVVHVSERTIIYQDVRAPSPGGYTAADFEYFAALFDDPIYPALVEVFGEPSDIDGNGGRILILFTPVVNELTPAGSESFVAGFFYGLDLLPAQKNSNGAEIFYSLVPDPEGRFGQPRNRAQLRNTVPPVLAHEFQHMIHFNQRNLLRQAASSEELWLSEALAHAAEYVVATELQRRGELLAARNFRFANIQRAATYLESRGREGIFAPDWRITLGSRGGAWLFVRYLEGHFGGEALLGALTRSTLTGVANVRARTQREWEEILGDFAVALWATDAPQLAGAALPERLRFTNLSLRSELQSFALPYRLVPANLTPGGPGDFAVADTLDSTAAAYATFASGGAQGRSLHVGFTGPLGSQWYGGTRPLITVLRYR